VRTVSIFMNNANQAIRIPKDMQFEGVKHRLNKGLRSTYSFNVTPAVHLSMTYLVRDSCFFELPPDLSVNAHLPMYEVSGGVRVNDP
jgi:hypothetical protein